MCVLTPERRLRGRRVPAAGPGEDPGGAGAHGVGAVGGAPPHAAAGGVREGHGGRRVQRHHMGRGGGPFVPGDWAREGRHGEAHRGASGERDLQHRALLGAQGARVL